MKISESKHQYIIEDRREGCETMWVTRHKFRTGKARLVWTVDRAFALRVATLEKAQETARKVGGGAVVLERQPDVTAMAENIKGLYRLFLRGWDGVSDIPG